MELEVGCFSLSRHLLRRCWLFFSSGADLGHRQSGSVQCQQIWDAGS
jgi:hypothetical protein